MLPVPSVPMASGVSDHQESHGLYQAALIVETTLTEQRLLTRPRDSCQQRPAPIGGLVRGARVLDGRYKWDVESALWVERSSGS